MKYPTNHIFTLHARLLRLIETEKHGENDVTLVLYLDLCLTIIRSIEYRVGLGESLDRADIAFLQDINKLTS